MVPPSYREQAGLAGVAPPATASTDRASVFIKAQPVCMTATETLVSSRLMKTDDAPLKKRPV